jgi:hypothetical protein
LRPASLLGTELGLVCAADDEDAWAAAVAALLYAAQVVKGDPAGGGMPPACLSTSKDSLLLLLLLVLRTVLLLARLELRVTCRVGMSRLSSRAPGGRVSPALRRPPRWDSPRPLRRLEREVAEVAARARLLLLLLVRSPEVTGWSRRRVSRS